MVFPKTLWNFLEFLGYKNNLILTKKVWQLVILIYQKSQSKFYPLYYKILKLDNAKDKESMKLILLQQIFLKKVFV